MRTYPVLAFALAVFLLSPASHAAEKQQGTNGSVKIGFVSTLFKDSKQQFSRPVIDAFGAMVRTQTGLNTEVMRGGDAFELCKRLGNEDVHLGIFQGVEFAWARQKDPTLRPLMVIVNQKRERQSCILVRDDSKARSIAELKGKSLALPVHSRAHCELFLCRGCQEAGNVDPEQFFGQVLRSETAEDALDDLYEGDVEAVLVDKVAVDRYQNRKPGRSAKLKVIGESEPFPPSVIAYRPGSVDEADLKKFHDGLLKANSSILARHMLTLWRMSAFETVPEELDGQLASILKAYPPPRVGAE